MLSVALASSVVTVSNKLVTDTLFGKELDPADMAKSLLTMLPLSAGLSVGGMAAASVTSKAAIDILSGEDIQVLSATRSAATVACLGLSDSFLGKTFITTFTTLVLELLIGRVPGPDFWLKDCFGKGAWAILHELGSAQPLDEPTSAKDAPDADNIPVQPEAELSQPQLPVADAPPALQKWEEPEGEHLLQREAVQVDPQSPALRRYWDNLIPAIDVQLASKTEYIVTDARVEEMQHIRDADGNPGLRYTVRQTSYNADVLRQDHWKELMTRLASGEVITWDHVVLALLSAVEKLTPQAFEATVQHWTLHSSLKKDRMLTVDVYESKYLKKDDLKPEQIFDHDTITLQRPGKDLFLDNVSTRMQKIDVETLSTVHTITMTADPVDFEGKMVVGGKEVSSLVTQEVKTTVATQAWQELRAKLEGGNTDISSSPVQFARQTTTQWTSFEGKGDLTKLAQAGPISPEVLQETKDITLVNFDQCVDPIQQEVAAPYSTALSPTLQAASTELSQGNVDLLQKAELIAAELDNGVPLDQPDSMVHSSKTSAQNVTSEVKSRHKKRNILIDDTIELKTENIIKNTQHANLSAQQVLRQRYTEHVGAQGLKEVAREPQEICALIREETTKIQETQSRDVTTISRWPESLGQSVETGPSQSTREGHQIVAYYKVQGKDISEALSDGQLLPEELQQLGAERIHLEQADIPRTDYLDTSSAGREFQAGSMPFIPFGNVAQAILKQSYGFELTPSDYLWAVADVGLCLVGGGTGTLAVQSLRAVTLAAAKGGIKAGVKEVLSQSPKLAGSAVRSIEKEMVSPYIMVKSGLSIPVDMIKLAQKTPFFSKLAPKLPPYSSVRPQGNNAGSTNLYYGEKAKEFMVDTYHRLNNFEFSLGKFPYFLKDMSIHQKEWVDYVARHKLAKVVYKSRGITYTTDKYGRPLGAFAKELKLNDGVRDNLAQKNIGKFGKQGDEGGHLIAKTFGGEPGGLNLVPQNFNLNRGAWKRMENSWRRTLSSGNSVTNVTIRPVYDGDSLRPYKFEVKYTMNSQNYSHTFYNAKG